MLSSLHLNGHIVYFFFRNKELSIGLSKILGRKIFIFYEEKPSTQFMLHTYDLSYALLISVNLVLQKKRPCSATQKDYFLKGKYQDEKNVHSIKAFLKAKPATTKSQTGKSSKNKWLFHFFVWTLLTRNGHVISKSQQRLGYQDLKGVVRLSIKLFFSLLCDSEVSCLLFLTGSECRPYEWLCNFLKRN